MKPPQVLEALTKAIKKWDQYAVAILGERELQERLPAELQEAREIADCPEKVAILRTVEEKAIISPNLERKYTRELREHEAKLATLTNAAERIIRAAVAKHAAGVRAKAMEALAPFCNSPSEAMGAARRLPGVFAAGRMDPQLGYCDRVRIRAGILAAYLTDLLADKLTAMPSAEAKAQFAPTSDLVLPLLEGKQGDEEGTEIDSEDETDQ